MVSEGSSVCYYIYGDDINYLQVLLKNGGKIIALDQSVVSFSNGAVCCPLPATPSTIFGFLSRPRNRKNFNYSVWANKSNVPVSIGISPFHSGSIVKIGILKGVYLMPGVLLCMENKFSFEICTKFRFVANHPCQHSVLLSGEGNVFLASSGHAIERNLAESEVIYIRRSCLLGFQETCHVKWPFIFQPSVNITGRTQFLEVKGPGVVYIQSSRTDISVHYDLGQRPFRQERFFAAIIVLCVLLSFMFIVDLWLESYIQEIVA